MEVTNENESNISEEQMKAEPNISEEQMKAESNTADEPVKAESNTADEPVKAESNNADEPMKAESNIAVEPVKAESNIADEPVKTESNNADEPVKTESNNADEPVKAESNIADEPMKAESNIADEPMKAESNNADEPMKAESNNADEPMKAESNNADEPMKAESNNADEPMKAESNNADEPMKAESNIADEPMKAESNNADEPMKAESNNADEPMKAESNIADEPMKAESNNADEPMKAESNIADEPMKAESNNADEPMKAESNNADEPMKAESNNADEPMEAESNNADEPMEAESNNADEPMKAESNNVDEPMKVQGGDSSASESEANEQKPTSTDAPSGFQDNQEHIFLISRNATCSLTLDSDVKEHIEPKLIETLAHCIINLDSSSDDELAPPESKVQVKSYKVAVPAVQVKSYKEAEPKVQVKSFKVALPAVQVKSYKEVDGYVIIDSDSDDDCPVASKEVKTEIEKEDLYLKVESVPSSASTIFIDDEDDGNAQDIPFLTEELSDQKGLTSTGSDSNSADFEKPCQSSKCGLSKELYGRSGIIYKECTPVPKESRRSKTKKTVTTAVKPPKKKCRRSKKKSSAEKEEHENKDANCNIPGCFLRGIENEKCYSGKNFKRNRDELVQKIYALFNSSVFDNKLPENIEIKWNNKMLRTAGLCTTCRTNHPNYQRYATIDIALKICDSADRLRDILIHEMCHVASWILDGVHSCHGSTWKYYARKSNMVHPELPKITRCHNYKINYKIHYECTQCKSRVGRYSKSLNTDRFICGNCWGPLVLVPLTRKDGTPIAPHVRPFAKFVKEHYRVVKKKTAGICHRDVMRELSKAFLAKKQMNIA
ncbi:germ cell nuclear acidic protein [Sorex fumeus]|uniref:germ cell nuclear acidic protein n=1 Tax=Sorex fumeus TaxID=62283 RepID=UPI0024AD6E2A|nr:germ cell nuclear acidic protein [Sorex fumeus]